MVGKTKKWRSETKASAVRRWLFLCWFYQLEEANSDGRLHCVSFTSVGRGETRLREQRGEVGAVSCFELLYLLLLVLGGRHRPGRSGSRKQYEPQSGNTGFKYSTDSSDYDSSAFFPTLMPIFFFFRVGGSTFVSMLKCKDQAMRMQHCVVCNNLIRRRSCSY